MRAVWIGVICTVLAHLALWWAAPHLAVLTEVPVNTDDNRSFLIELSPDSFAVPEGVEVLPEPPRPDRFVEVNPDAPTNAPDETRNFGAQDQQLAQPEPAPDMAEAEAPATDGEQTDPGSALVSGQSAPSSLPQVAPSPPSKSTEPEQAAPEEPAKLQEIPRPGPSAVSGDNPAGLATTAGTDPGSSDTKIDGVADGRPDGYALLRGMVKVDRNKPQSRPELATIRGTARPAPLLKNSIGTKNIGAIGYDAKWSDYGAYLQKLIETVDAQWQRQILMSRIYPVPGTKIVVVFILNKHGAIDRIVKVGGSDDQTAGSLCVSAITERAPYGEWSEDMIGVLGESQEITFSFFYR